MGWDRAIQLLMGGGGGHVIPRCSVMTHRITIKLQLPGKSRLIFNSISLSLHPGSHKILKQAKNMRGKRRHVVF